MKSERPKLQLPWSGTEKFLETLALLEFLAFIALVALRYGQLPDQIPAHFDLSGNPDDSSGKWVLWLLVGVGAFIYAMLTVLSFYPHTYNYVVTITPENAAYQYRLARNLIIWFKAVIPALFLYIVWAMTKVALGNASTISAWFLPIILGGILIPIIAYFVLSRRNTETS